MNIYLEEVENNQIRISDNGTSLMRLSYLFDFDTDNKKKILNDIVLKRGAEFDRGNITLTTKRNTIFESLMSYVQLVSEICNMDILSHETIANLFYDYLISAIKDMHISAKYVQDYQPTQNPDLIIDHAFWGHKEQRPIFLFGIKDTNKAQQSTIQCLMLKLERVPHKSVAVFQDIDSIAGRAKRTLLNATGKVFTDLDGFKANGKEYFEEELQSA